MAKFEGLIFICIIAAAFGGLFTYLHFDSKKQDKEREMRDAKYNAKWLAEDYKRSTDKSLILFLLDKDVYFINCFVKECIKNNIKIENPNDIIQLLLHKIEEEK